MKVPEHSFVSDIQKLLLFNMRGLEVSCRDPQPR